MKETLELIINSLVNDKEAVSINEIDGEKSVIFEVKVAENDMGKVIGKEGRIAKAIRTIMKSLAAKEEKRITKFIRKELLRWQSMYLLCNSSLNFQISPVSSR